MNQEWRVDERYANVLEALFVNFPTILRGQSGAYLPLGNSPLNASSNRTRPVALGLANLNRYIMTNYLSLLGWIGVFAICVALWPWLSDAGTTQSLAIRIIPPTATPVVVENSGVIVVTARPLPTPTPTPVPARVVQTANLRVGPGTDFAIKDLIEAEKRIRLVGQALIPGDEPWYRLDNGLWIYGPLVNELTVALPIVEVRFINVVESP